MIQRIHQKILGLKIIFSMKLIQKKHHTQMFQWTFIMII